jgi:hypothetical protein
LHGVIDGRVHDSDFDCLDLKGMAARPDGVNGDFVPIDYGVGRRQPDHAQPSAEEQPWESS